MRGGPQQLALGRVARDAARGGELVEQAQRELGDVPRVRGVRVELRGEVEHARAAHVVEQRLGTAGERLREEDPLAQAGLGRLERVEAAGLEHLLHDDRAGERDVAAHRLDARDAAALGDGQAGEPVDEVVERARARCR